MSSTNPFAAPGDAGVPRRHSLTDFPWLLFSFEGRIPRRAYWGGVFLVTALAVAFIVGVAVLVPDSQSILDVLGVLIYIAVLWSNVALQVKRWHDLGRSGAWVLVNLVAVVGGFYSLLWCGFVRGDAGPNEYGADPT